MESQAVDRRRSCYLWRWGAGDVEWERRTLVVGGLSPLGLAIAGVTFAASRTASRRRHRYAMNEAVPRWRFAASGSAWLVDRQLLLVEESGITRTFDLGTAAVVDEPMPGWIRFQPADSDVAWAIQFKS